MKGLRIALAAAGFALVTLNASAQQMVPAPAPAAPAAPVAPIAPAIQHTLDQLRERALHDDNGYAIVRDLVTQIGPRRAGSPEEARARDWAVAMLRAQHFANIRVEPFTLQTWRATHQTAEIVSPAHQPIVIAALGGSTSTPEGGLEAEIATFPNLEALATAPDSAVRGKIVFIDEPMARTEDGSGYGAAVRKRSRCQPMAQQKGAVACLIRSVGTNSDRFAHQGGPARERDGAAIPAASVSPPDSDILARLSARGPVRVRLDITSVMQENQPSGNIIAEIRGRERPNEIVLVAAHLDSWDLGQGAIDDGAGVAIITAAARLINDLPRHPRRTIRVFFAGSEEPGGLGGQAYFAAHHGENHVLVGESDLGSDLVWRASTKFGAGSMQYARAFQGMLAPLAIVAGDNEGDSGTDVEPLSNAGVPVISLNQDASRYFDFHHTANDTLDKIDPVHLRQNIAAWAVTLYLAAETDWNFHNTRAP